MACLQPEEQEEFLRILNGERDDDCDDDEATRGHGLSAARGASLPAPVSASTSPTLQSGRRGRRLPRWLEPEEVLFPQPPPRHCTSVHEHPWCHAPRRRHMAARVRRGARAEVIAEAERRFGLLPSEDVRLRAPPRRAPQRPEHLFTNNPQNMNAYGVRPASPVARPRAFNYNHSDPPCTGAAASGAGAGRRTRGGTRRFFVSSNSRISSAFSSCICSFSCRSSSTFCS